ncbi:MAG: hypothetical protein OXG58_10700 [Gemmatimonadetes bacterium]|nr:hypothetical protein [Gemmatimonadota bacterium]MCY3944216.1 hypothetical protein [Gemmatimonadota bacterium]
MDLGRNAALISVSLAVAHTSAEVQPLWAFPPATIALLAATTVGVLLSYGMVTAVVAVRAAGEPGRGGQVAVPLQPRDEAGGRAA